MSFLYTATLIGALASSVAAHGIVTGIITGNEYHQGYDPSFQYRNPAPVVVGWTAPLTQDRGFVGPDSFTSPDIICHKGATPAGTSASVAAGDSIQFQWTEWPESHHGPVINYLAACNGPCENVDKASLRFFKFDEAGLIDGSASPGVWASDELIKNNNTYTATIPSTLAPGNYVLRHEIIALHSAGQANGAQNYPQCFNIEITGGGSVKPAGIPGTQLYTPTDAGILKNIYANGFTYDIPGPALMAAGGSGSGSSPSVPTPSPAASSVPATTTQVAASSSTPVAAASTASATEVAEPTLAPAPTTFATSTKTIVASDETTTVITTTVDGPAPTDAPTPVVSEAPIVSDIAAITSAVPSEILNSPVPTAVPTTLPDGSKAELPQVVVPEGTTFRELLRWFSYIVKSYYKQQKANKHARDFTF